MTVHQAAAAWQQRQALLLQQTYLKGWRAGVQNYRTQSATPPAPKTPVVVPTTPAPAAVTSALTPALTSLARMGVQLAALVPTVAQIAATATLAAATALAVREWLKRNGWLLAAGASVAWAGEQAGYAQTAAANGLLLQWQLDPRAHHCDDCPLLAALPPLPLNMWPTLPGDGLTDCHVGCRCSLRAVAAALPVLTPEQQELLTRVAARHRVLVAA